MSKLYLPTLAEREQRDKERQEAWDKRISAYADLGDKQSDEGRKRFEMQSIVDARMAHTMKSEQRTVVFYEEAAFLSDAVLDDIHDQCMEDARRDRIYDQRLAEARERGDE